MHSNDSQGKQLLPVETVLVERTTKGPFNLMQRYIQGLRIEVLEPIRRRSRSDLSLFFIHGAGMDSSIWESQTVYFARRYPTYCINLPGRGGSEGEGEEEIYLYAQRVQAVLDDLMPRDPYLLVGHSMGGAIAMEIAVRAVSSMLGIVLMGTAARLRVMPIVFQSITKHRERFFKSIAYVAFGPDTRNKLRERLVAATRRCPLPVTEKDLRACNAFDIDDRLSGISVPTLIVCGAEDQLTPVSLAQDLKERITDSRLAVIPGAGHMVMLETPAEVNREIDGFLAKLQVPAPPLTAKQPG